MIPAQRFANQLFGADSWGVLGGFGVGVRLGVLALLAPLVLNQKHLDNGYLTPNHRFNPDPPNRYAVCRAG